MSIEPLVNDQEEIIYKSNNIGQLKDYDSAYGAMDYEAVLNEFDGLGDGKYNIAYEAVDRHCIGNKKDKLALLFIDGAGRKENITFNMLRQESNRLAQGLSSIGVAKGDRVFAFLPRIPEVYYSAIAIPKVGAIFGPLFSAFGPEAVKDRLAASGAKVLITTVDLWERVAHIASQLPELAKVIIVGEGTLKSEDGNVSTMEFIKYRDLVADCGTEFTPIAMDLEDPFIIHYTSGSTGKPKGVTHVHKAMLGHYQTAKWVLDLSDEDLFWCTADPGWVTGTSYGVFGPWLNGVSQVVYGGGFDAVSWYKVIEENKVT
ncbi:MAG: AMP-binding protein, partial [Bacillota bacterium]|nr:AMP-binding protein [Bacillota bacterium]